MAGEVGGVGGFDAAPELAPEIDFPADAETDAVRRQHGVRPAARLGSRAQHRAGHLLLLRIEQAAGDRQLRARFQDAHAGRARVRVGALRLGDQRVEHRVVEVAPPFLARRARPLTFFRRQRGERAARPVGQRRHLGPLEVRPDRGATPKQQRGGEGGQARTDCAGEGVAASAQAAVEDESLAACCRARSGFSSTQRMKIW